MGVTPDEVAVRDAAVGVCLDCGVVPNAPIANLATTNATAAKGVDHGLRFSSHRNRNGEEGNSGPIAANLGTIVFVCTIVFLVLQFVQSK